MMRWSLVRVARTVGSAGSEGQRVQYRLLVAIVFAAALLGAAPAAAQAPLLRLLVTSAADPGDGVCDATCTLRDAILTANDLPLPVRDLPLLVRIEFAIGGGAVVIRPQTALPFLERRGTVVDGRTQPGFSGRPLVMLDGRDAALASGLVATAPDVEFRSLAVGNFPRYGLAAVGEPADGVRFLGNWAGLSADGRTPAPNLLSGIAVVAGADNAVIGDSCADCGNRLAGNSNTERSGHGVLIGGTGTLNAHLRGNVIGLGGDGTIVPNDDGILIVDGAHATVGGAAEADGNVVSGNRVAGIEVRDTRLLTLRIEGNRVGLDEAGRRGVGNDVGIFISGGAANVLVGTPGAGNVVSGNRVGIAVEQRAERITVAANVVGLDVTGQNAVPNAEKGISVVAGAREIEIGGIAAGAGNWIAGNATGLVIGDAATRGVQVQGNQFGLALDGITGRPNGVGIAVSAAGEVSIGGVGVGAGNVIVASAESGIVLDGVSRVDIRGNRIGLRGDDSPLGNAVGITLTGATLETLVQGNRIGGNSGPGVALEGDRVLRNRLSPNVFLDNGGLAIDLNHDGPTPNDAADTDQGPNTLLNSPLITEVRHDGRIAVVRGTGAPGTHVEVYRISPARPPFVEPHPSGFGPGAEFLGSRGVSPEGEWEMALGVPAGVALTVLSVDAGGNTSEFGANVVPVAPLLLPAGFRPVAWLGGRVDAGIAFSQVSDRLSAAYRFQAAGQRWEVFRPRRPLLSDLTVVDAGDALWLQISPGPPVAWPVLIPDGAARSVRLEAGLNFVTWSGPVTPAGEALAGVAGVVDAVFRWNSAVSAFDLVVPSLPGRTPPALQPGDLLWVRVSGPVVWEQPAQGIAVPPP